MAATQPFAVITASASGLSLVIVTGSSGASITGNINSTGKDTPCVLIVNQGPNTAFVRMSSEATPTASINDIPMLGNTVRLFTNPVQLGNLGVAVMVSVTTSPNTVTIIPGEGGI